MTIAADIEADTVEKPPLVEIFQELAEAKALLWANYEIELQDAVDHLQAWAMDRGLVAAIGQDCVQEIMAVPFALVRAEHFGGPPAGWKDPRQP